MTHTLTSRAAFGDELLADAVPSALLHGGGHLPRAVHEVDVLAFGAVRPFDDETGAAEAFGQFRIGIFGPLGIDRGGSGQTGRDEYLMRQHFVFA